MAGESSPDFPILETLRGGVPEVIDTPSELDQAIQQLRGSGEAVAIDTERAQGFRYGSSAWLVQIRRESIGTFLIDSHSLPDLRPLNEVLSAPWILHSAKQDLPALAEAGMFAPELFDTETAARLIGLRHFSLLSVCEEILGVSLKKNHQAEDWSIRPLPNDWLRYAAMDVELLPELHTRLTALLGDMGRLPWAQQEFDYARTHMMLPKEPSWRNLKGLRKLRTRQALAVAKELWETRESIAKQRDIAPTRILPSKAIIEAAQRNPDTRRRMLSIPDFHNPRARPYKDEFWAAIRRANTLTADEMPDRDQLLEGTAVPPVRYWKRSNPEGLGRLQKMRAVAAAAAEPLDLDPEVVLEPVAQRYATWKPTPVGADVTSTLMQRLQDAGARPWQLAQVEPYLSLMSD